MANESTDAGEPAAETTERRALSRRYGAERIDHGDVEGPRGLLSPAELRLLERVERLGRPDRNSLYEVVDARVTHFIEEEWPLILTVYPEYAARVREEVCRVTSDQSPEEE